MERPPISLDRSTHSAIEEFLSLGQPGGADRLLDVDAILRARGNVTPWQFLCGLADCREIAFHGTGDQSIESFEPREPIDFAPFGHQKAVFATSDPIWAMFYAIVDRDRYRLTLNNGCILLMDAEGCPGAPQYYFSITRSALRRRPWRTGYVYFLPAESFVEQPAGTYAGHVARILSSRARSRSRRLHGFRSPRTISPSSPRSAAMRTTGWPSTREQSWLRLRGRIELAPMGGDVMMTTLGRTEYCANRSKLAAIEAAALAI
jgi:hypothetical protein